MLLGCSAGFLSPVKIKGTHSAIQSGVIAAESMYGTLTGGGGGASDRAVVSRGAVDPMEPLTEVAEYAMNMEKLWVYN